MIAFLYYFCKLKLFWLIIMQLDTNKTISRQDVFENSSKYFTHGVVYLNRNASLGIVFDRSGSR